MIETTLILLKPDAVQRQIIGEIITRFEKAGFKIVGLKMIHADEELSKTHYAEHVDKSFYQGLQKMITEAPLIAMAIQGVHAVKAVRKMVGSTEPHSAQPGTIRGDYAHISYDRSDQKQIGLKNLIHASDSVESAKRELKIWFNENELFDYKTVHEFHTI